MSFAVTKVPVRRVLWLLLGVLLVSPLAGCVGFQSMCSPSWVTGDTEQPINDVLTIWDNNVRVTQDVYKGGARLHGLVGRLLLLNEVTKQNVDAQGTVMVCMHDVTGAASGKEPAKIAEWKFRAEDLKQLKRTDKFGDGYTLFLPWEKYYPGVKQVHIQVCYITAKGVKHFAEPTNLTLQSDEATRSVSQRNILPGQSQPPRPLAPLGPQPIAAPTAQPQINVPARN